MDSSFNDQDSLKIKCLSVSGRDAPYKGDYAADSDEQPFTATSPVPFEISNFRVDSKYTDRQRLYAFADAAIRELMQKSEGLHLPIEDLFSAVFSVRHALPLMIGRIRSTDLLWSYLLGRTDLLVLEHDILLFSFDLPVFFYKALQDCVNRVLINTPGIISASVIYQENPILMTECEIKNPSILRAFLLRCASMIKPSPQRDEDTILCERPVVLHNPTHPALLSPVFSDEGLAVLGKPKAS